MLRQMCGVQLRDGEGAKDLMWMSGLDETIDRLAITNSVCWYGHVLSGEDGHAL